MKQKGPGKPFKVGKSGNPKGRPKTIEEFRKRCRAAVDKHVIKAWEKEIEAQGPHWVKCSEMLAAYGYCKPPQPVTGASGDGPIEIENKVKIYLPSNGRDVNEERVGKRNTK